MNGWQPFPNAWATSPIGTGPRKPRCIYEAQSITPTKSQWAVTAMKGRRERDTSSYRSPSLDEMRKAEQATLKSLQEEAFSEEIKILKSLGVQNDDASREFAKRRDLSMKKTSSLYRLDPFLDENGVLRVGGRIRNAPVSYEIKHPVVLPSKSHVTILLVRYHHERISHQGRGMTLNDLRSHGYWLIGGSSCVYWCISKCVICRKLRGALPQQKMGNLPTGRLGPAPPFTPCRVESTLLRGLSRRAVES